MTRGVHKQSVGGLKDKAIFFRLIFFYVGRGVANGGLLFCYDIKCFFLRVFCQADGKRFISV